MQFPKKKQKSLRTGFLLYSGEGVIRKKIRISYIICTPPDITVIKIYIYQIPPLFVDPHPLY